jgi:hypothetical protein
LGKEDNRYTQSHGGATEAHRQNPLKLRPDLPNDIAFSDMHRYCRQLLFFSERSWNKTPNMVWGSKLSSTTRNFLLQNPGFKRALITSVINTARFIKNFGLKKEQTAVLCRDAGNIIEVDFESKAAILGEKHLVPFRTIMEQNVGIWYGAQNYHQRLEIFFCKISDLKGC